MVALFAQRGQLAAGCLVHSLSPRAHHRRISDAYKT